MVWSEYRKRKERLKERKTEWKEGRTAKRVLREGRDPNDVAMVNVFRDIGINYLAMTPKEAFALIPIECEGRRVRTIPPNALAFIQEHFDVEQVKDSEDRMLLHFLERRTDDMAGFLREIAEEIGEKGSTVTKVIDGLIKITKRHLRHERKFVIPKFCRFTVRYQKALPKRKGIVPFTGEKKTFPAKDASNKLRCLPAKQMKDYVAEKVEVVEPPEKEKKAPDKKDKKK